MSANRERDELDESFMNRKGTAMPDDIPVTWRTKFSDFIWMNSHKEFRD